MDKIVVLWSRFGPYHIARLRSASLLHAREGVSIVGLEVSSSDSIYQWNPVVDNPCFERRVVFAGANYSDLKPCLIYKGTQHALDSVGPCAVAINGWSVPEAIAALRWCRRNGRVAILMSESKQDEKPRSWWIEAIKSWRVRDFDAALTGGLPHKDYICKLGMPRGRVFLGYDAVDNAYFAKEAQQVRSRCDELRKKHGLPDKFFYSNTRFLPRKNIDGLLRAYAIYLREMTGDPWGLVITGSGETEQSSKQLARDLDLTDVIWPGFVQYDRLPLYYGLASAFIHPAKAEPWGLVVNEAAASGLPLLVSRMVGARYELVHDGHNGLLCDPFVDRSMAEAMLCISKMPPDACVEMGECSRRVIAGYGPERFAEGLWSAFCAGYLARHRRAFSGREQEAA